MDPTVANADYSAFLTALEKYTFDIVVYDGTESVVIEAYASFVKRISERVGRKCQAVMAGAEDSNTEWGISAGIICTAAGNLVAWRSGGRCSV